VFPQVMESGPITKVCQYNHQKFKEYSIVSVYQVSQILLALSSGLMGVSCLQDPLFESW